ncbi:MAG TPA: sigma-70 family RNA polymerase sigma factor [Candidatus Cybelea sp.]|nr:sigma-70 family RNA polymerase sigma factor [Candidatus Cybelea sp.]
MSDDDQLMLRFQQGSREAFRELFERYRDPVYGFFRRRIDHPSRAEELTQDCFLVLLRNAARYEARAGFRSYLYGIAIHLLANERRKAGREVPPRDDNSCPADNPNPEDTLWVRRALAELDENDREILMLREYEQLAYTEIAAVLDLPVNTVRSRLFRARIALKEKLMPVNGDFGGLL